MTDLNRQITELLKKRYRNHIIDQTRIILNEKFHKRINDMELYARIFYASIISNYGRANSLASNVGMVLPELEAITKALYQMSDRRKGKQGSFETSKAFEVSKSLELSFKTPMFIKDNVLTYKLKFRITNPILLALEHGDVSWQELENTRIMKILQAALSTVQRKRDEGKIKKRVLNQSEKEIVNAISKLKRGTFQIVRNKRPYLEITVKNLVKQKDFITILTK